MLSRTFSIDLQLFPSSLPSSSHSDLDLYRTLSSRENERTEKKEIHILVLITINFKSVASEIYRRKKCDHSPKWLSFSKYLIRYMNISIDKSSLNELTDRIVSILISFLPSSRHHISCSITLHHYHWEENIFLMVGRRNYDYRKHYDSSTMRRLLIALKPTNVCYFYKISTVTLRICLVRDKNSKMLADVVRIEIQNCLNMGCLSTFSHSIRTLYSTDLL